MDCLLVQFSFWNQIYTKNFQSRRKFHEGKLIGSQRSRWSRRVSHFCANLWLSFFFSFHAALHWSRSIDEQWTQKPQIFKESRIETKDSRLLPTQRKLEVRKLISYRPYWSPTDPSDQQKQCLDCGSPSVERVWFPHQTLLGI